MADSSQFQNERQISPHAHGGRSVRDFKVHHRVTGFHALPPAGMPGFVVRSFLQGPL